MKYKIGEFHLQLYTFGGCRKCSRRCVVPESTMINIQPTKLNSVLALPHLSGNYFHAIIFTINIFLLMMFKKLYKDWKANDLRLQSLSAYSRENAIGKEATDNFLNEAIGEQRLPVKAHFNLLVWTDNQDELKELRNITSSALTQMDATPKIETEGAPQIFWAGHTRQCRRFSNE